MDSSKTQLIVRITRAEANLDSLLRIELTEIHSFVPSLDSVPKAKNPPDVLEGWRQIAGDNYLYASEPLNPLSSRSEIPLPMFSKLLK